MLLTLLERMDPGAFSPYTGKNSTRHVNREFSAKRYARHLEDLNEEVKRKT